MFPKISSANPRRARAIREVDLFSLEGSSGVFMRKIRAPRENLSENLAKNFRGSDAFSANGAASQVRLGHRPRDSIVAELTSAEGANQLRFQGSYKAGTNEPAIESRFQRWRVFLCHTNLGRCPRLALNAAPLALNSKRRSGDRRSLIAVIPSNG
jgi:hypothetical protein